MTTVRTPAQRVSRMVTTILLVPLLLVLLLLSSLWGALHFAKGQVISHTNEILRDTFEGTLTITWFEDLTLTGARGVDARLVDPEGEVVVDVQDLSVDLSVWDLVRQLLAKTQPLTIDISQIHAGHAYLNLSSNERGEMRLATAFAVPESTTPTTGASVILSAPAISFAHVWVHGPLASDLPLDAEASDLRGALSLDEDQLSVDKLQLVAHVRRFSTLTALSVNASGALSLALEEMAPQGPFVPSSFMSSTLDILIRQQGSSLHATLSQDQDAIELNANGTLQPESLRPWIDGISEPMSLHAQLGGDQSGYRTELKVGLRDGLLALSAVAEPDHEQLSLDGTLRLRKLSPSWLSSKLPQLSPLDADLAFAWTRSIAAAPQRMGGFNGEVQGQVAAFTVGGERIPALKLKAALLADDVRVEVRGQPPLDGTFVDARGKFPAQANVPEIRVQFGTDFRLVRTLLPPLQEGTGTLQGEGHLSPATRQFEVQVDGDVRNLKVPGVVVLKDGKLRLHAEGAWSEPHIDGRASASELTVLPGQSQQRHFEQAEISLRGTPQRGLLLLLLREQKRRFELRTTVGVENGLRATHFSLHLRGRGAPFSLFFDELIVQDNGDVFLDSLRFGGQAQGELDAAYAGGAFSATGSVRDLPLSALSELLQNAPLLTGTLDLDVDWKHQDESSQGRLRAVLSEGHWDGLFPEKKGPTLLHGSLDLAAQGGRAGLLLNARTSSNGTPQTAHLQGELRLPPQRRWSEPLAWLEALQELEGETTLDLDSLPPDLLPQAATLHGGVYVKWNATQNGGGRLPLLRLKLETSALRIAYAADGKAPQRSISTIQDYDLEMGATLDPEGDEQRLYAQVVRNGRPAAVVLLRAQAAFDAMLREPVPVLLAAPLDLRLRLPPQAVEDLPQLLGLGELRGLVGARMVLNGSMSRPKVTGRIDLTDLLWEGQERGQGLGGMLQVHLDDTTAELSGLLTGPGDAQFAVSTKADLPAPTDTVWRAPESLRGELRVTDFPLRLFRPLVERRVAGALSGHLVFDGWGTPQPRADLDIDLSRLNIADHALDGSQLSVSLNDEKLRGELSLRGDGFAADITGETKLAFSTPFEPVLGDAMTGQMQADRLPLSLLIPLTSKTLAGLGGELNAQLEARVADGVTTVEGRAELRDGKAQFPGLGQSIQDANLDLIWRPNGSIELSDASFRGVTGRARLSGGAQMDGLFPQSARLRLQVARNERLPASLQGLGLGEFWGDIETHLALNRTERTMIVDTVVRSLHVRFPQLPGTVQSLEANPRVQVGAWVDEDDFVELPLQPLKEEKTRQIPWDVRANFDLGKRLWLEQGPTRRVQVGGKVALHITEKVRPKGTLRLSRGQIEINGRMFEVREGTITLHPQEPDNPIILAKAVWEAPDDVLIVASFSGPAKSGTMTLSSEPPLPEDQILSLLLFGDTQGLTGADQGSSDPGAQAAAVGGRLLTQGLNKVLTRIDAIDITTRISGGTTDNVRPEVVVRLTNSLSLQVGYNLQEPGPGESPDRTLVSIEVRLRQGHAISATLGDQGSSLLDWVWRHRY